MISQLNLIDISNSSIESLYFYDLMWRKLSNLILETSDIEHYFSDWIGLTNSLLKCDTDLISYQRHQSGLLSNLSPLNMINDLYQKSQME